MTTTETPTFSALDRRRGHRFLPPKAIRNKVPGLYGTGNIKDVGAVTIHVHYFMGGADWYIAEADWNRGLAWGYTEIAAGSGEWGYINLHELANLTADWWLVERDRHFDQMPAREIPGIRL